MTEDTNQRDKHCIDKHSFVIDPKHTSTGNRSFMTLPMNASLAYLLILGYSQSAMQTRGGSHDLVHEIER